jgi:glycosyltransferase involved in cell wall biosynthesis
MWKDSSKEVALEINNKKSVIVARSYPIFGGMGTWLEDLVKGLRDRGHKIVVYLVRGETHHDPYAYRDAHSRLDVDGIIDGRWCSRHDRTVLVKRVIERARPDVFIPVGVYDALGAVSALAGTRPRTIYPIHEYDPRVLRDVQTFSGSIDRVVCCDRLSIRSICFLTKFPRENILFTPHGIYPATSDRVTSNRFRIGVIGRLIDSAKGIFSLVEICRELERLKVNFRIDICGTGIDEVELRCRLTPYVDEGKVRFLGWRSRESLYEDIYPNLDALLLMSERETGPIVAWEAMAHGVVPVVSEFLGLNSGKTLTHMNNAMVYPFEEKHKASEMLAQLATDTDLYASLSIAAKQAVTTDKSISVMLDRWSDLINSLARLPRKRLPPKSIEKRAPDPQGRLDNLPIPIIVKRLLRRFRARKRALSAQSEWPYFSPVDQKFVSFYEETLRKLDAG